MRLSLSALLLTTFVGCASAPKMRLNDFAKSSLREEVLLPVSFVAQKKNLCGPTVIKMAAELYSPVRPIEFYQKLAFREEAQGTFKADMLSAARRLDLAPYKVLSVNEIITQLNAGHPVIVFQNVGLSWVPQWHFALLVGYNDQKNIFYLHTGSRAYDSWKLELFLKTWKAADSWAYVFLPPAQLSPATNFDEALDNALLFERMGKDESAKQIYFAMIKEHPDRYEPHLGLANLFYNEQNRFQAIHQSQEALNKNPSEPALLFNLAILYHEDGQYEKAQEMKDLALVATPEEQKMMYLEKLSF